MTATVTWTDVVLQAIGPLQSATRDLAIPEAMRAIGAKRIAEIGVERGLYTATLRMALPEVEIHAVDAWLAYRSYREHVSQDKLDAFYAETRSRLDPLGVRIHRGMSSVVAATFPDESLDAVYLDGNHVLPQVIADLAAWVPKVRSGGIIAGHDFGRSSVGHVREAVIAWTSAYRIDPWFVLAGDRSPSFLWVQP